MTCKTTRREVTRGEPCAVCAGGDGCSRGEDGLLMCRRRTGPQHGFVHLGAAKGDDQWHLYRPEGDPHLAERERDRQAHQQLRPGPRPTDWEARARAYAANLTPALRSELAEALGLPVACLDAVPLIGFDPENRDQDDSGNWHVNPCWTFPERDGGGRVVGINRRDRSGRKKAMPGGCRGLTIPARWRDHDGPVYLPEGPSDVLTLAALGLPAVGRPSNTGGVEQLAKLLADVPSERRLIVLGENDCKPDGDFPGRRGALQTAQKLTYELGRAVVWAMPPGKAKDVRQWALSHGPDPTIMDAWQDLGDAFGKAVGDLFQQAREQEQPKGPRFQFLTSAEFAAANYRLEWLVRRLLVRGQPGVVGGPRKALKTSALVDLALSLGTGTPFLGEFQVARQVRVAVMSGESGQAVLQETARRVSAAKGIDLASADVLWEFQLPQLADAAHLAALQEALKKSGAEVLLLDPLYLCLLAGVDRHGPQASNMYQMGPLFAAVARACLTVGCTPILAHHFRLQRADHYGEPQLEELSHSGIQEFARQWVLLGRREKYEPGTGSHQLWLSVGGSAGQSGLWALDIEEGVTGEDFEGRRWQVTVGSAAQAQEQRRQATQTAKQERRSVQEAADEVKLLQALDRLDPAGTGAGLNRVILDSGVPDRRARAALERLRRMDPPIVENCPATAVIGSGATRKVQGLRRVPE